MDGNALRSLQAPLKAQYQDDPTAAVIKLEASGTLGEENVSCSITTGKGLVEAGLHPATGGDGSLACSGDMLLEALVACSGVTLGAVARALGVDIRAGTVRASGDLDFRGTLAVAKDAAVGFRNIELSFELDTDASPEELETLYKLTKRYCAFSG
jgi:uncharacterized OsmC-like protein